MLFIRGASFDAAPKQTGVINKSTIVVSLFAFLVMFFVNCMLYPDIGELLPLAASVRIECVPPTCVATG